jgi:hypothetical protein
MLGLRLAPRLQLRCALTRRWGHTVLLPDFELGTNGALVDLIEDTIVVVALAVDAERTPRVSGGIGMSTGAVR